MVSANKRTIRSIIKGHRIHFLFHEFCLWRSRCHSEFRHVVCDDRSNALMRELERTGHAVIRSDNPKEDDYVYGLVKYKEGVTTYQDDAILLTDKDLGFDLSNDPELP